MADQLNAGLFYFNMELGLLVLWYFKVPFELSQQFARRICTENPEFGNGAVYGQGLI